MSILTKKDLWLVLLNQFSIRSCNNFERQQASGYTQSMLPVIKKCYPDDKQAQQLAMERHMELFLTHDMGSSVCVGVSAAMEERIAQSGDISESSINAVKTAMMGPVAGLGDSLIQGTARPILAGLGASFALQGSVIGSLFFFLCMTSISLSIRYFGVFQGYSQGVKLVTNMQKSGIITKVTELAAIAAYMISGAFVALIVVAHTPISFTAGDTTIKLQETLDNLMP
ncbi:TPA: PTS system mannose/fructose/sorbose family transporter subunit IID, partial [Klebsiella pneumoniae]|nr:PTS system mannose/fructose/sorbose family transporter subunit IID [Klebsiella pneumoniae]